jgi:hypothetical protein
MYNTSPAFSIAGKCTPFIILDNKVDKELKPTPLTYHLENWNPKKTPSWK